MLLLLPIAAYALLAAHLLFHGMPAALCAAALVVPSAILFVRKTWALRLSALMLVLCGVEWLRTAALLVMRRASEGRPWGTALAILLLCALLSWISIAALRGWKKPA